MSCTEYTESVSNFIQDISDDYILYEYNRRNLKDSHREVEIDSVIKEGVGITFEWNELRWDKEEIFDYLDLDDYCEECEECEKCEDIGFMINKKLRSAEDEYKADLIKEFVEKYFVKLTMSQLEEKLK